MGTTVALRERRLELGLTQRELANAAQVTQARLSRIELGGCASDDERRRLAQVLEIDLATLVFPEGRVAPKRKRRSGGELDALASEIVRLYNGGLSMEHTGDRLEVSERHVYRILHKRQAEVRPPGRKPLHPIPEPQLCECGCGDVVSWATPYQAAHGRGKHVNREHLTTAQRKYPEPGERTCANPRCGRRFRPAAEHAARSETAASFCTPKCYWTSDYFRDLVRERALLSYVHLVGLGRGMLNRKRADGSSWVSKSVKCSYGGSKPPGPDAQPRGRPRVEVPPDLAAEVRRLAERGWGRRTIANATKLTPDVVRSILASILTRR